MLDVSPEETVASVMHKLSSAIPSTHSAGIPFNRSSGTAIEFLDVKVLLSLMVRMRLWRSLSTSLSVRTP